MISVTLRVLLFLGAGLLMACQPQQHSYNNPPWQTHINDQRRLEVFSIELGETTLAEARRRWGGEPSLALFRGNNGTLALEAYFDRVMLGPFQVRMVARLGADQALLSGMRARGGRPRPGPSGDYRFNLETADVQRAMTLPVDEISYVPSYHIEGKLLRSRFGQPSSIRRLDENTQVWLYAPRGILVTIQNRGKDIIHYVNPDHFTSTIRRMGLGEAFSGGSGQQSHAP